MTFRPDDTLDPDLVIKHALEAKVDEINRRLEEMLISGKQGEKLEKLMTARAAFIEVLRSPRLYLARPPSVDADSITPGTGPVASGQPAGPPKSFIPLGAIPQPRRVGGPTAPARESASQRSSPAPQPASPTGKGMMSFLKQVQSTAPATAAPGAAASSPAGPPQSASPPAQLPPAPQRPPVAHQPPPERVTSPSEGMMSFLKSVQSTSIGSSSAGTGAQSSPPASQPSVSPPTSLTAAPPAPVIVTPDRAAAPSPAGKGQMLSFLEKVRGAASDDVPSPQATEAPAEIDRAALLRDLKERAASSGFKDIYEMLRYKRLRLVESRARLMQSDAETAQRVLVILDQEIAEIDALLKKRPDEIARKVEEFREVAAVDKGGLAAIRNELAGLLDEIK